MGFVGVFDSFVGQKYTPLITGKESRMNCHYHPDREAVFVCELCGRPICAECATTLRGRVMCSQCKLKVADRVLRKLNEKKESEESRFAYSWPIAMILISIPFFIIFSLVGIKELLFIPAILFGIGVTILFMVILARKRQPKQYKEQSKPTRKKVMGWTLFGVSVLCLVVWSPISAFLYNNMSIGIVVLQIIAPIIGIIVGCKLAEW